MGEKWKKRLPIVAAAGAVSALLVSLFIGPWFGRQALLIDTGETRHVVETATLARLQRLQPTSLDDPAFREAVAQAENDTYVAAIWLFAPDGRILQGSRATAQDAVERSATDEARRILGMLPEGMLSAEQRKAVLAASAMQKEAEHNDVYRHLLREVRGPDDELVGWIGVTYDVSPAISAPGVGYFLFLVLLLLAVGVYWLSLPVWVWLDARARGERAWVWATFVLLGNLAALIAYILARAPRPRTASIS